MLNKGSGIISWRLRGQLGALPLDIDFQSTFELDLITGRVGANLNIPTIISPLTYPLMLNALMCCLLVASLCAVKPSRQGARR